MSFPLAGGVAFILTPQTLLLLCTGILLGLLIGLLPGIRAIHGAVIFLPIAYSVGLEPNSTLAFLICIYFSGLTSSSIVRILNEADRSPDIPLLWQLKAANYSTYFSTVSAMLLIVLIFTLARRTNLSFGPSEYVMLVLFAFASLSVQAGKYPTRTLISTGIGVLLSTVGIDANTGALRFTFGQPELYDGIEITTIAIGIFVISEIIVLSHHKAVPNKHTPPNPPLPESSKAPPGWSLRLVKSTITGFIIGLIPAAGTSAITTRIFARASLASASARPGHHPKDPAFLETARTAAGGGALVPMLAFCIPGNSSTAIMIGALFLYNITPGPTLFLHDTDIFWALFAAIAITATLLFFIHRPLALLIAKVPQVPAWIYIPVLISLAFIGTYAVHQSLQSLLLMLLFGTVGCLLLHHHYPLIPLLMGFILGELLEDNLRRALILSSGKVDIFFTGPVCLLLWVLILVMIIGPLILRKSVN